MSQPPHNGAGKPPPPPPPPDLPAEPGQRPTVKVSTVSLGPRPASPPSGARPASTGLLPTPSTSAPSGPRPAVAMPPDAPPLRPTARVPTLSAAPATPPPPPVESEPSTPRPGSSPLSSAAVPVVPLSPPGAGRPVSGVGMARPPPPPPAALQPMAELAERCARLDQMDYFEILRVERTAAPADIKKAFYRESRAYHPDRFFQLPDKEVKERVNELYKRVTEAYYVLRDDAKRRQYTADVAGPERAHKLRFTESSESETRAASKRQVEEQIGSNPKGRQFYQTGVADADAGRWASAERNLKMALTYEPANTRYKEKLAEVQKVLLEESRKQGGDSFKIR